MAYVESFARAMERARASVSYWDHKALVHLQAAHDAEMRQCSKSEYHRGFEDGKATRDADQWQLDRERAKAIEDVRKVVPEGYFGSHDMLSEICRAIYSPVFGWTAEAGRDLCDRLIHLLGGESIDSDTQPDAKVIQNEEKYQFVGYDVLGNERQKVVCRLRGFEPRNGGKPTEEASKLIRCIIGREDCHVACGNDLEEARDRLIELLGAQDAPNATDFAGNRQNGPKSGEKQPEMQREMPESRESLQEVEPSSIADERHKAVCELQKLHDRGSVWWQELVVALGLSIGATNGDVCDRLIYLLGGGECNFSGAESDTGMQDDGANLPEMPEEQSDHVSLDTPLSITSELRKFAETFRYEWYDVKDGSSCYTTSDCPPSLDSVNMTDYINGIADRIEEQFNRICSQHEAVLQQTISETVDEHECEMDELRADYEQAISDITGVERGEGSDLLMPVDVFMHVRDGLRHDIEMWRDRAEDMRMERDELLDKLQAISVLCEQDDG